MAWTSRLGDGFWALTRYEDVVMAARHTAALSNAANPRFGTRLSPPIESDRPEHTVYRRILSPHFSRDRLAALEPAIRDLVDELLDPLLRAGEGDLVPGFTSPLPARVLCALLRIPVDDAANIKRWSDEVFASMEERGNDPVRRQAAEERLQAYGRALVAERMSLELDPDEDLVTGLITKQVGDRRMTNDEIVAMIRLLLSAGHNSTTNALGNSILALARDPELQERLRTTPSEIPSAVDELLRYESPVMATKRLAVQDLEVRDRLIRAGEAVFLVWSSANRDERHFDRPDECLIDRDPQDHVAFGRGIHRCVGMTLALIELRIAFERLLARTRWFGLAGPVQRTSWERLGVSSMPMSFEPR